MADLKKLEIPCDNGSTKVVYLKKPSVKDHRDSQAAYNKAFRQALENGAILKRKLNDYMVEQGVWDEAKEKRYQTIMREISNRESALKAGGIPLKKAKEMALEMRRFRAEFNELISERQSYENNTAEGQADNARFDQLIMCCVVDQNGNRIWNSSEDYERDSVEPWANKAASELANDLYGLDPNYYNNLPENQFLIKYKFVNKDLRLINKDGHLVDTSGRLINDQGRYVAYRDNGGQYFVDYEGNEIDENGERIVKFEPFLDDDGNPIADDVVVTASEEVATTPKRGRKKE